MDVRIATWNVNGLRARWDEVNAYAAQNQPDVLCLQEIKADASQVPEPLLGLPGYVSFWHGNAKGYSGVSLHVRRGFGGTPRFSVPSFDFENRIAEVAIDGVFDEPFRVATVYVPNGGKDYEQKISFLKSLAGYAEEHASGHTILCGDLNVTRSDLDVHEADRKAGAMGQRKEERALLDKVLAPGFIDALRASREGEAFYTWWAPWRDMRKKDLGWRIDYVLLSRPLSDLRHSSEIARDEGTSDHAAVLLTLHT